ncbi:MAG: histidinol dehydrogenase [Calditrichaeota bacterium]|nr:histidinol dehydrogenase [Calditrichota bacterium]
MDSVKEVIADIRANGDDAVKKWTKKFDGVELENLRLKNRDILSAVKNIQPDESSALRAAAENIRLFAEKQVAQFSDFEFEIRPGVFTGQRVEPIRRVGVYCPGGSYPLPSTVLMGAIPARVAGVEEVVLCSPPTHGGSIHPAILAAAVICDIEEIYQIGGVQAIAAMAYGTESLKPVDKIVGPGNKYVTAAKKEVFGVTGIDFIAGPTELLIIADESADPAFIAADLLGQAEHDVNAEPILITTSRQLALEVEIEVRKQLQQLKTRDIAEAAVQNNSVIILTESLEEACDIANRKAPEHLELQVRDTGKYSSLLKNYGSLFIGSLAAEVLGDYSSGLNHTLPTNTTARYTGGLSVKDFLKLQTTLRMEPTGLKSIGGIAKKMGEMEGLDGHAKSIGVRLK